MAGKARLHWFWRRGTPWLYLAGLLLIGNSGCTGYYVKAVRDTNGADFWVSRITGDWRDRRATEALVEVLEKGKYPAGRVLAAEAMVKHIQGTDDLHLKVRILHALVVALNDPHAGMYTEPAGLVGWVVPTLETFNSTGSVRAQSLISLTKILGVDKGFDQSAWEDVIAKRYKLASTGIVPTAPATEHLSSSGTGGKPVVTAAQLEDAPLTMSVSTVGWFAKGHSWYLSVNSAGQAELAIDAIPERTRKRFQVSKEHLAEFRKALAEERFFELRGEYGELVPDGSEQSVSVAAGPRANTVKIHFLMNWVVGKDKAKLQEPSRAVRLLIMVRGWFDEAEAVDLRKYGQRVLDAAQK